MLIQKNSKIGTFIFLPNRSGKMGYLSQNQWDFTDYPVTTKQLENPTDKQ